MIPHLLPHVLEAAADRDADHVALRLGDDELGYGALVERAGRIAATLTDAGVAPGDPVGVWALKSLDTAAAVHGIQRCGAISVPIDPLAPSAVMERTASAIGLAALIVDEVHLGRLTGEVPARVVLVLGDPSSADVDAEVLGTDDVAARSPAGVHPAVADDPVYMITTSGSTGTPKAIVHTHRSALRYAQLAAETYGLGPDDRLANIAPFHFDQSTFELYAGPVAGATTVLVPELAVRFPAELSALVARDRLTVWYSVPTILTQLLHRGAMDTHDLSSLRWVLFGGEVFAPGVLAELMGRLPGARFSNVYGPAEVNQCTHHHLDVVPPADGSVPIGRPWADTEIRIVDTDGATGDDRGRVRRGELHVRTTTMMAGYWRRPDLDSAAFVERAGPGGLPQRWYRTGDIVELDDDGDLHFRGRVDRQVKIRGNRVELEAVEAAVNDVDGVVVTAAVTIERDGDAILVAIVESDDDLAPAAVRAAVRATLPPHAVPDEVVVVDALPRTQSGKIDNRAAAAAVAARLRKAKT